MSDPKRANLITVGAATRDKTSATKTVRLAINLGESNENEYPELNYKELVKAEEKRHRPENGKKNPSADPFSDNDDDVERIAKKFEEKYGTKSSYGRKSKKDLYADIGVGYDENDSFIDNTDGYDEMMPPSIDTIHGGFYINCGSLEFKSVPDNELPNSDTENITHRGSKRRISSSHSEEESSDSSSDSDSQDNEEKDDKAKKIVNGNVYSHKSDTERRKKENKPEGKKKAKRPRTEDSSAATSGVPTSDENAHVDGESADSRTSQSDSLTSKPAPSSENPVSSDSSRDGSDVKEVKEEYKLPAPVQQALQDLKLCVQKAKASNPLITVKDLEIQAEAFIVKFIALVSQCDAKARWRRKALNKAASALGTSRSRLAARANHLAQNRAAAVANATASTAAIAPPSKVQESRVAPPSEKNVDAKPIDPADAERLINEALERLKLIIEEKTPSMIQNYKAECERVKEENKKITIANATGPNRIAEKRLPKRRFPWCTRTRNTLAKLRQLGGAPLDAAQLLAARALPLFPVGFVRLPTLLKQAHLNKEVNINDIKIPKQKSNASSHSLPDQQNNVQKVSPDKQNHFVIELGKENGQNFMQNVLLQQGCASLPKVSNVFGNFSGIDIAVPKADSKPAKASAALEKAASFEKASSTDNHVKKKDDKLKESNKTLPCSSIGSVTITPVVNNSKESKYVKPSSSLSISLAEPKVTSSTTVSKPVSSVSLPKLPSATTVELKSSESCPSEPKMGTIRVRSPTSLLKSDLKEKHKRPDGKLPKADKIIAPLTVDTSYPNKRIDIPKHPNNISSNMIKDKKKDSIQENNIPRPGLVPAHLSPTFAKPPDRKNDAKKPKLDPQVKLTNQTDSTNEVLNVDDSSSDIEVIEENNKEDPLSTDASVDRDEIDGERRMMAIDKPKRIDIDDGDVIDKVMKGLTEMKNSQERSESSMLVNNARHGKVSNDKYEKERALQKDKLAEQEYLKRMDGSSDAEGE